MTGSAHFFGQRIKAYEVDRGNPQVTPDEDSLSTFEVLKVLPSLMACEGINKRIAL